MVLIVFMNKKLQIWLPLLLSITMLAGMWLGYRIKATMPGKSFFAVDKAMPFQEVLDLINNKYVDDVAAKQLNDTAIAAILAKLDPHSVFIPADELQAVNDDIAGNFFGIGVEFEILNDTLNVLNVVLDGPSAKAGIATGDKFIKVNDSVIAGNNIHADRIRKLLRGDVASTVNIVYNRNGQLQTATITRGVIPVSSIDAAYIISNGIGYIKLNKFSQVTYKEFMIALQSLQKQGLTKLILDVRGNGGGVLDEAAAIADEFLDGDKLVTYTQGVHFAKKEYRCKKPGLFETGPLVVLADEGSASASEILLGALQDWDRATIIGRRSFGKGLVQEQYDLSDGSALRLTVARYYTPLGRSIQRPYNKGEKEYYNEVVNRFHDGETTNADSVKLDTSKVFITKKGKKLYGAGGINADVFVGIDTITYKGNFYKLINKNSFGNFAYQYFLQNKIALKAYKNPQQFASNFLFTDADWQQFNRVALKDSININTTVGQEKKQILDKLKSALARQIWRSEGFYEVANTTDKVLLKAIEILK